MKGALIHAAILAGSLSLLGCVAGYQSGYNRHARGPVEPMSVGDVVKMSHAGIADSLIISMIHASGSQFTLRADDVIALADSGVNAQVIDAMIHATPLEQVTEKATTIVATPWFPYSYWGAAYAYDPFWYSWYSPFYPVRVGWYNGWYRGGHAAHFIRGGRRGR
jgi:hypothetical protein